MLCIKTNPSSLLILTTLILASLFFFSSADAVEGDGVQRSVLENGGNSTLILAKDRTRRRDPLDNNNYYTGGWDIKNSSYLASVLYTGSPYFDTALIWFIGFAIFLVLVCMYMCCCRKRKYGYSKLAYAISLILLSLFTIGAVIGSVVLYTGQAKFHDTTRDTLQYVLDQANSTVANLTDVSNYLTNAKSAGVNNVFLPTNVQSSIDNVNNVISGAADTLHDATENNKDFIFQVVDAIMLFLIILAAVMLALTLLGFLLSISGLQCLVYILVIACWILVTVTLILCGVFLVLNNVVGDTCVAMDDWVKHPTANTTLDSIIPCVDPRASQEALNQSKDVTYEMARLINGFIVNVSNANIPRNAGPAYYNQSGPLLPILCNPYNPDKTNRACAAGEVHLDNATQVWRNYQCQVSGSNICTTVGRLTPGLYDQMSGAVNVSYGLYRYGPFLTDLVDCTFVRDTFTKINEDYCDDAKLYSRWVYIGLAMVSIAVMLSMILWVLYARERRHRKYTKLVDANSGLASTSFQGRGP